MPEEELNYDMSKKILACYASHIVKQFIDDDPHIESSDTAIDIKLHLQSPDAIVTISITVDDAPKTFDELPGL